LEKLRASGIDLQFFAPAPKLVSWILGRRPFGRSNDP